MKRKLKFTSVLISAVITVSYGSINAIAVDDSYYYYDVKKASDYALTFCYADPIQGEGKAYSKYYTPTTNKDYVHDGANCTNYISQILYYGGYKMRGTPDIIFKTKSLASINTDKWFYYCLENKWGTENDVWSSTWSTVDGITNLHNVGGLYHFFTQDYYYETHKMSELAKYSDEYASFICTFEEGIEYCDDFAEKYNLKRGDVVQVDYERDGFYDHSLYVWCTEPEIRFCSNSNDYFAKAFSSIDKKEKYIYRIIHTTDHAIAKSAW